MRFSAVMLVLFCAGLAHANEPEHGTTVIIEHEGLSYAAQFWTGSDKVVIAGLPEADLRAYPAATAEIVAARALEQVGMACTLGSATPDQYGLPPGTTWDVAYRC